MDVRTQVVISGGGPVGLSAAVELGRRGISCIIVEPRDVVSHARPRCKTVNVRTMEHLRRWGVADELRRRAPLPPSWSQDVVFCTSLVGRELSRFTGVLGLVSEGDRFPEVGQQAPQYLLEELLRDVVSRLAPCTMAIGSTVIDLEQDDHEVRVVVVDEQGVRSTVGADFALGCDGPRSVVRERIGAAYEGKHALRPNFGMVFSAPALWPHVAHGPAVHYWVINAAAPALMGPLDTTGTWWIIAFGVERTTGERDASAIINAAVGMPVNARLLSTDPWTARMQIVDRMRDRRVFLAGDAAHLNPPFGGHGLNTGIGDAVDLGWKIAAVLDGWGGPALLDSYEIERRPIQQRVIREATANMRVTSPELLSASLADDTAEGRLARRVADARIQETKDAEFHALDLVLDVDVVNSPVIHRKGRDAPQSAGAVPGHRLPHRWLDVGRSLYDELGDALTLVVLSANPAAAAIDRAAQDRRLPLRVVDLRAEGLRDDFGSDLILVRPDQYIAWRGNDAPADVDAVLDVVTGWR